MTKVGVLITGHRYVDCIGEAFVSISMQASKPDTTIVVLDRPRPRHLEAYRCLTESYGHETIIAQPALVSSGISFSRNVGFDHLIEQGMDFVIPLDEDDIMDPDCIKRTRQAIDLCPDLSVHYWDWVEFGEKVSYTRCPEWSEKELFAHPFIISSAAISVKMWLDVKGVNGQGYDCTLTEQGLRWEDYLFYLEGAVLGHKMGRIGVGALTKVRRHGQTGTDIANRTIDQWRAYASKKFEDLYDRADTFRETPISAS